jgi:hypothetical protein
MFLVTLMVSNKTGQPKAVISPEGCLTLAPRTSTKAYFISDEEGVKVLYRRLLLRFQKPSRCPRVAPEVHPGGEGGRERGQRGAGRTPEPPRPAPVDQFGVVGKIRTPLETVTDESRVS